MELEQLVATWPVDNVASAVISGDRLISTGDCNRVFELASVTKLLAAYGFLIAVEEGVFELDQELGPAGSTVRHLLAHASGVGFKSSDPVKPVGSRRIYSSFGFELLAAAVEEESGMAFADYLDEAVFQPLDMRSTQLWGSAGHEGRSSVADLVSFARELLNPRLLAPATLSEACSVQFPELNGIVPGYGMYKPCPWGLGFEIKGEKDPHWTGTQMPANTVGHFGQSGTYLWMVPESGVAMVALTDRPFGAWAKEPWAKTNDTVWHMVQP
ncbi:serine hydrolase domain-containing protein [Corynebacterium pseudotuberculosis]|uniref:Serine hydrolase n=1 Tax=Corynebacterium pseudotuberculosis (strain C231) TaxID=681645 RepID=D9QBP3_CORP2|nr:serine hydrolase domain-containing protein [Corynebacterium pseudotuberculosis]ADK29303.1 serine hydrolase [Corynebacterium pseudotuberculosis FRC41]ADL10969.1 serine hydrolase [Corynebacterium pseudotuberculosis C231]ADL21370.1 beta-lactamase family protein [Corynebacterium pseudotuberculosis 1002]ADO26769.1 serine hydrolase [Corynebacterium pseudotuberculosis I19]AEK92834.1 Beta-lactamase transpeptidase-like protein [Corynebacterium pseudotuberculosis PAT10]